MADDIRVQEDLHLMVAHAVVRLSSQQVFYCGATDADGPPIGLVFADFVAPLVG